MELYLKPNASYFWIQSDNFISVKLNYVGFLLQNRISSLQSS